MDTVSSQPSPFRVLPGTEASHRLLFLCVSIFVGIAVGLLSVTEASAADIIRVKTVAAGSGNGSSWNNAATLQYALQNLADPGDEVWVATGVYTPGITAGDTFPLPSNVGVYGGFAGDETDRAQRDWESNPTVLSGDIGGDDIVDASGVVTDTDNIVGVNSYHVVTADGTTTPIFDTTVLDGFIITAGRADGDSYLDYTGGGFLCNGETGECCPSIANVFFSANKADARGGAMSNVGYQGNSSPVLTNVTFSANKADDGGAIHNFGSEGNSSPVLTNVTFSANKAEDRGGAMYNYGFEGNSSPVLTNVTFSANKATSNGGAMVNNGNHYGNSSPILTNVTFSANEARYGGAMYNEAYDVGHASPKLINVTFSANKANSGGAMYNFGFEGNSSPVLTNVTFSANKAEDRGGAMVNNGYYGNSSPILTNVTFSANKAATAGGAMYNDGQDDGNASLLLTNIILWGNDAPTGAQISNRSADITIAFSLIEGGVTGDGIYNDSSTVTDGGGNLAGGPEDDPLFVEPVSAGAAPTTTGNLRLQFGSPAIDVGSNSAVTVTTDLDGNPRKQDGNHDGEVVVDLGPYEAPAYHALTVVYSGNGEGDAVAEPAGRSCMSPCVGLYPVGTVVTLTATAGPYSKLSAWSGEAVGASNPITVTMDSAKVITASFVLKEYALDATTVGAGSVSKEPDLATYPHGTAVVLTASPDTGALFSAWSGDVVSNSNPITVTMDSAKAITASFILKEYALDVVTAGAGSVRRIPDLTAYPYGAVVILAAKAYTSSVFSAWSGDVISASNPITVTMAGHKAVTATFTLREYPLDVATVGDGSVSKEPDLPIYSHGTAVILTANANTESVFSAWSGDVGSAANPLSITMAAAKTITATFVDAGSVHGIVVDENGNPIDGVTVIISNEITGVSTESTLIDTTDATGGYRFDALLPGSYTLIFSKLCYATPDPVIVLVQAKKTLALDDVVMVWTGGETSTLFLPAAQNAP